jgi:hypothetical protein
VDEPVLTVIVEEFPAVTEDGLNDTVTPLGAALADSDTLCAEPDVTAVFTVAVAGLPAVTVPDPGETETE